MSPRRRHRDRAIITNASQNLPVLTMDTTQSHQSHLLPSGRHGRHTIRTILITRRITQSPPHPSHRSLLIRQASSCCHRLRRWRLRRHRKDRRHNKDRR